MNFEKLTHEEQTQLKEYLGSISEIRKSVNELLEKCGYSLKENDDAVIRKDKDVTVITDPNNPKNHSSGLELVPNLNENRTKSKLKEHYRYCENKKDSEDLVNKLEDIFPNVETSRKLNEDGNYIIKFWI